MNNQHITFTIPELSDIYKDTVLRSGYSSVDDLNENMQLELIESIKIALSSINPKAIYRQSTLNTITNSYISTKEFKINSKKLSHLASTFIDPKFIIAFTITLGQKISNQILTLQNSSMIRAFFIDAAGSVLAEKFAVKVEESIQQQMSEKNIEISTRFSPGYCDWETHIGQEALFSFLDNKSIGVKKLDSGMMIPEKSISGIFIAANSIPQRSPCFFCNKKDCPFRRNN